MALVTRFEDLKVWQEARELSKQVYELSRSPRFSADRALVEQIRRAAVSVMNNVAEGFDSGSQRELRKFLHYAIRSTSEVQSCLYAAVDQAHVGDEEFREVYALAARIKQLSGAFIRRLAVHDRSPRRSKDVIKEPSVTYVVRTTSYCGITPQHRSTAAPQHEAKQS